MNIIALVISGISLILAILSFVDLYLKLTQV